MGENFDYRNDISDSDPKTKLKLFVSIVTAILTAFITLGSALFLIRVVFPHLPLLPDVAVVSASAASYRRLSNTSAAAAEAVNIGILIRNNNSEALSFTQITLEISSGVISGAPPFEGEGNTNSVVWFRMGNLTVPVVGPARTPALEAVEIRARVRFGGHAWLTSSDEISMSARCSPAKMNLDLSQNNENESTTVTVAEEAEAFMYGGCKVKGLWDNNEVMVVIIFFLIILVDTLLMLTFIAVARFILHKPCNSSASTFASPN